MSIKKDLLRYNPRKEQTDALSFIKKVHKEKPDNKFFLLNLPVGTGKSHLALMISDWYTTKYKNTKVDIITAGKFLQDQYAETYESICDLKGKDNYQCDTYSCSCLQGKEFSKLNKTTCSDCPYSEARNNYMSGSVSMTNFHLYLIYAIYSLEESSKMETRKSNILIVDECHEIEEIISSFVSIKITEHTIKKLKLSNDVEIIKQLHNVSSISEYVNFLQYLSSEMTQTIDSISSGMGSAPRSAISDNRDLKLSKLTNIPSSDVKLMNIISEITQYQTKLEVFLREYNINQDNWVLESNYNEKTKHKELSLEPIWSADYLEKYIWSRYDMVFLMSGTILDKRIFSEFNGIDVDKSVYYSIPSPFDVMNRPIYYMPLGKMSYANKSDTFKNYVPYINKVLTKYIDKKGIIHTNSFELSKWIENGIKDNRLVFHDSSNKDEVVRRHFEVEQPSVLVSPSVGTGVSFDNDRARFQVIAKIPYPSLNSMKNKIRMKNNPEWYQYTTIAKLLQMCGRIVRNIKDNGDTIIIDGSFGDILKYNSHLIPAWVRDSIKRIDVKI
jgi:ATP-dependent DNA helicase DinG